MTRPPLQPADPAARRRLLVAVALIAVAGVAGLVVLEAWLAALRQLDPAESAPRLVATLLWVTGATSLVVAAFGVYAWRLGGRVCASLRFPPPGVAVVRDTPIIEGIAARRRGAILRALGIALVALAAVLFAAALRFGALVVSLA